MNIGLFDKIELHIYPFPIWLSVAQSDDDFIADLIENGLLVPPNFIEDSLYYAKVWTSSRGDVIFRISSYPENYYQIGAIAHDALHCVISILHLAGLELNDGSEEAYTYLLGYIVTKITELLELEL